MKTTVLCSSLAMLATAAAGQEPAGSHPADIALSPADMMVPIHSGHDEPAGGDYGTWAAGPDYKVSFDDGATFYPMLGEAYPHNLPLRWRTERIAVGDHVLVDGDVIAERSAGTWRYELRYPGVTEAYDVRVDGVEQTFVLDRRPDATGDLVIRGRVEGPLSRDSRVAAHDELMFRDESGKDIVSYGEAFVVDAGGRRFDVATSYSDSVIEMRLSADWLASAVYPVVVDPLIGSSGPINAGLGLVNYPSITRDDINGRMIMSLSRAASAADYDCYVYLLDDGMNNAVPGSIFADVTNSWSTKYTSVAYVRATDRWVLVEQRNLFSINRTRVRPYIHDASNTTFGSGTMLYPEPPPGQQEQFPSVGGDYSTTGDNAYIVCQRDVGPGQPNGAFSEVIGRVLDTASMTVSPVDVIRPSSSGMDSEWPTVTDSQGPGLGSWVVVWQSYDYAYANDDWDINGVRVIESGAHTGIKFFGAATASRHSLHPMIAGRNGRYLLSFLMRDNVSAVASLTGDEIGVQRIDWFNGAEEPVKQPWKSMISTGGNSLRASVSSRALAYDHDTDSHWTMVYRTTANDAYAARVGYTGEVVETATVYGSLSNDATSPAICFNESTNQFVSVFGTDEALFLLRGQRIGYSPSAITRSVGSGCSGTLSGRNNGGSGLPYAGSEFYELVLSASRPIAAVWLLAGAAPAALPLPASVGCELNLDPNFPILTVGAGLTDGSGDYSTEISLLDTETNADVYWQYLVLDGGQLYSSNGLLTQIR